MQNISRAFDFFAIEATNIMYTKNASSEKCGCKRIGRKRSPIICFFYYGGGCRRSECGPFNYRNDVPEYSFSRCKLFEPVEALIRKPGFELQGGNVRYQKLIRSALAEIGYEEFIRHSFPDTTGTAGRFCDHRVVVYHTA